MSSKSSKSKRVPSNGSAKSTESEGKTQSAISSFFRKKEDGGEPDAPEIDIPCPICTINIGNLGSKLRNAHVNQCIEGGLNRQVIKTEKVKEEKVIGDELVETREVESVKIVAESGWVDSSESQGKRVATPANPPSAEQNKRRKHSPTPKQRLIPWYKVMDINNQKIAVDAFCYGPITGVKTFFLTHFHSDHYGGLSKSWNNGLIYCTEATAKLCEDQLNIDPSKLRTVPMNEWYMVDGIEVLFLDANHCPGAAIILFQAPDKTILHTGDFRASQTHIHQLKKYALDEVYLDTTYMAPSHCFPAQQDVIEACGDYSTALRDSGANSTFFTATIDKFFGASPTQNKPLVLVGTYTIGKERVAMHIAKRLGTKIFTQRRKYNTLMRLNDPELASMLAHDGFQSAVHLVPMREINFESLEAYFKPLSKHFTHCLAISPTGWSYHPKKNSEPIQPPFTSQDLFKSRQVRGKIQMFRVPYSEHSSFTELRDFCTSLSIKRVIPTVNTSNPESLQRMHLYLDAWIKKNNAKPEAETLEH